VIATNVLLDRGELIASLDATEIDRNVAKARSIYNKTNKDYKRTRSLLIDSIGTEEMLDNIKTKLSIAESDLQIAEFNLSHAQIRSSRKGFIENVFFEKGEVVPPGKPVCVLRSNELNFKFSITDAFVNQINVGDTVVIHQSLLEEKINGVIEEVAYAPGQNNLYEIKVNLINPPLNLKKGFAGTVHVNFDKENQYSIIPMSYVSEFQDGKVKVFKVSIEGEVNEEWLKCDVLGDDEVLTRSPVKESIISSNIHNVTHGSKVTIQK